MEIKFMPKAEEDLVYWKATGNKRVMKRITKLLDDILQHPFTGIGKPEPLKGDMQGVWSRRITDEHRLVYSISHQTLLLCAAIATNNLQLLIVPSLYNLFDVRELLELLTMLATGVIFANHQMGKIINDLQIAQFLIVRLEHLLITIHYGLQDGFRRNLIEVELEFRKISEVRFQRTLNIIRAIACNDRESYLFR